MNVAQVLGAIRSAMQVGGYNEARLAKEMRLSQSTLNRSLRQAKRVTATHRKVCKFFGILHDDELKSGTARDALVEVLMDIWDGSPEHAAVITKLLKAGSLLEAYGVSLRRGEGSSYGRR